MTTKIHSFLLTILFAIILPGIAFCGDKNKKVLSGDVMPVISLGVGLGVNDYGFGVGLEVPIINNLSLYADAGIGGWGGKVGIGANYHFKQITKGSVVSIGFANGSGLDDFETTMYVEPNDESQQVLMDLHSVQTVNLKYTYNFKMGNKSKFGLSAGYAIPLSTNNYTVRTPGVKLNDVSKATLNIMQPGGLILGFRFMFGIGTR